MENILYLAHVELDGSLSKPALEALTAAKDLKDGMGVNLTAGLIGEKLDDAAKTAAAAGASRVLGIASPEFAQGRYSTDAAAIEALCKAAEASIGIAVGTARWNRVLPGAAYRLGGAADLHMTRIDASGEAVSGARWYYRQRMVAEISRAQRPWLVSVDPGTHAAFEGSAEAPAVEPVTVDLEGKELRTQVKGVQAPPADEQTIRPEADLLFVAGAGWTKKQEDGQTHVDKAEELILNFLSAANVSLGGSKSLVDISGEGQAVLTFMTHLNQVGQTGATPRHPKGLATCCHGEEPHVVGWRFVNERRAVNKDVNCGWAQGKADVLYVADAFAVMKRVNELLGS